MVVADSCYSGTLVRDATVNINSGLERDAWLKRMTRKRSRTAPGVGRPGACHRLGWRRALGLRPRHFSGPFGRIKTCWMGRPCLPPFKRPVALESDQTPQYSDIRRSGHDGGDFLFVRRSATRTAALTAPPKPQTTKPIQPAVGVFRRFDPGDAFRDCDKCPELIVVPAGSFTMGSTKAERRWAADQGVDTERYQLEGPSHQVGDPATFCHGQIRNHAGGVCRPSRTAQDSKPARVPRTRVPDLKQGAIGAIRDSTRPGAIRRPVSAGRPHRRTLSGFPKKRANPTDCRANRNGNTQLVAARRPSATGETTGLTATPAGSPTWLTRRPRENTACPGFTPATIGSGNRPGGFLPAE